MEGDGLWVERSGMDGRRWIGGGEKCDGWKEMDGEVWIGGVEEIPCLCLKISGSQFFTRNVVIPGRTNFNTIFQVCCVGVDATIIIFVFVLYFFFVLWFRNSPGLIPV